MTTGRHNGIRQNRGLLRGSEAQQGQGLVRRRMQTPHRRCRANSIAPTHQVARAMSMKSETHGQGLGWQRRAAWPRRCRHCRTPLLTSEGTSPAQLAAPEARLCCASPCPWDQARGGSITIQPITAEPEIPKSLPTRLICTPLRATATTSSRNSRGWGFGKVHILPAGPTDPTDRMSITGRSRPASPDLFSAILAVGPPGAPTWSSDRRQWQDFRTLPSEQEMHASLRVVPGEEVRPISH